MTDNTKIELQQIALLTFTTNEGINLSLISAPGRSRKAEEALE